MKRTKGYLSGCLVASLILTWARWGIAQSPERMQLGISINPVQQKTLPLESLRERYLALRFGMFIHFNMGTFHEAEWVKPGQDPATFNPVKLDCGQWAEAAKSAGMKYAVLTTKHHDGFCLWPSQYTDYTVAATPLKGRDIVREYVDAFRRRELEPHFYFSIWDKQNGVNGRITPKNLEFIKNQLTELLSNYGPIGSITFDGWGNCGTTWVRADYDEIYRHVKSLQPNCLVTDHYQVPRMSRRKEITLVEACALSDILHYEEPMNLWVPEGNTFAACQGPTIQSAWFWKKSFPSEPLMTVDAIVNKRLKVLGKRHGNLLLNCAPNRDGLLDDNVIRRLAEVGACWMSADAP